MSVRERSNCSISWDGRRLARCAAVAWALGIAPAARAQVDNDRAAADAAAARHERARGLFVEGTNAYHRGDYAAARERFARAYDLEPAASTLRAIGQCDYSLRNYVAARDELRAALAETREHKALNPGQQLAVTELLRQIEPLVGQLVLELTPQQAALELDRAPVTGREFWLNAGEHIIAASAPGHQTQTLYITLEGGREQRLAIVLPANPSAGMPFFGEVGAATSSARAPPEDHVDPERSAAIVRGIIGLSAGAAGLWAGAVSGYFSAHLTSREKSRCTDGHCPLDSESALSDANTLANVSNVSFVLAALGVGYGLYELLTLPEARSPRSAAKSGTRIELTASGLLLHGQF